MKKLVQPSEIKGTIKAPASKSMMQRAIAIAALADGTSVLYNYTPCNDAEAAIEIAKRLGAEVNIDGSTITIKAGIHKVHDSLNCGESGLGIRMFTPIASLFEKEIMLNGEGSLKTRPISMLEKPMRELGVQINTNDGFVPITVRGPLRGGEAYVDGSLSSQILTGMLIALPMATGDTMLSVDNLKSIPYIDMTLQIIQEFGAELSQTDYERFSIKGNQKYKAREYSIEGDWSGASFHVVAAAIAGEVHVENVSKNSKQADIAILEAVQLAGAKVSIKEDSVIVKASKKLKAFEFNATNCPDLFPPLAALAAYCEGKSKIKGVSRLKHKESDRATVLKNEFKKVGISITIDGDYMIIEGGKPTSGFIHANNDHRIAMAAAVLALKAEGSIEIENAECIDKSYPSFYEDFTLLGALVSDI